MLKPQNKNFNENPTFEALMSRLRLIENSPDIIWIASVKGIGKVLRKVIESKKSFYEIMTSGNFMVEFILQYVNDAVKPMLGYSADEIKAVNFDSMLTPESLEGGIKVLGNLLLSDIVGRQGEPVKLELELFHKKGQTVFTETTLIFYKDEGGKPLYLEGICRDISRRKTAEQKLQELAESLETKVTERTKKLRLEEKKREKAQRVSRERKELYRVLVQNAPEGIFLIDNAGNFKDVNRAVCKLKGIKKYELLDSNLFDFLANETFTETHIAPQILLKEGNLHDEFLCRKKDGSHVSVLINAFRINAETILGFCTDITARKRLQKEVLHISEREQQRTGRDLHDSLGQSLTGIGYLASGLKNRLAGIDKAAADDADQISSLIFASIKETRSIARGMSPVGLGATGLSKAIEQIAENVNNIYRISCKVSGNIRFPKKDAEKVLQVYRITQEAVNNAVKHSHANEIKITLMEKNDSYTIEISDNGCGFSPAENPDGGMGTNIMRYRAETIGGKLTIKSSNYGSVVNCTIPV